MYKLKPIDEMLLEDVKIGRNVKERTCLRCGDVFLSDGPGNRRCEYCKHMLRICNGLHTGCAEWNPHTFGRDFRV